MTLDPRKSAAVCAVLGAWLALLALSFLPLWAEHLRILHRGTGLNDFWHFLADLRGAFNAGVAPGDIWEEQASNVATTSRILLGGAVVGLLVHCLIRRRKCR
jgi:hypothetical protein